MKQYSLLSVSFALLLLFSNCTIHSQEILCPEDVIISSTPDGCFGEYVTKLPTLSNGSPFVKLFRSINNGPQVEVNPNISDTVILERVSRVWPSLPNTIHYVGITSNSDTLSCIQEVRVYYKDPIVKVQDVYTTLIQVNENSIPIADVLASEFIIGDISGVCDTIPVATLGDNAWGTKLITNQPGEYRVKIGVNFKPEGGGYISETVIWHVSEAN